MLPCLPSLYNNNSRVLTLISIEDSFYHYLSLVKHKTVLCKLSKHGDATIMIDFLRTYYPTV